MCCAIDARKPWRASTFPKQNNWSAGTMHSGIYLTRESAWFLMNTKHQPLILFLPPSSRIHDSNFRTIVYFHIEMCRETQPGGELDLEGRKKTMWGSPFIVWHIFQNLPILVTLVAAHKEQPLKHGVAEEVKLAQTSLRGFTCPCPQTRFLQPWWSYTPLDLWTSIRSLTWVVGGPKFLTLVWTDDPSACTSEANLGFALADERKHWEALLDDKIILLKMYYV